MKFKDAANKFLIDGASRKRNPMRPSTIRVYRSQIENNLLPLIGLKHLQTIDGKAVKAIIANLAEQGLSARTIQLNYTLIKQIRESVIDSNGEIQYPCKWSADFLDIPSVGESNQPIVGAEQVTNAISAALAAKNLSRAALWAILAGTGLRISEARAISVSSESGNTWHSGESKIIVRTQMTREGFGPTKSKAGTREVDLAPELNEFLLKMESARTTDQLLVFPETESVYRTALGHDGITEGFHAFRRFRITHLEAQSVPRGLAMFWTGHGANDVHESYLNFGTDMQTRKIWCQRAGLGFELK